MKHQMKLNKNPFAKIKSGSKTIEIRLFDEKRQQIGINDTILFTKISYQAETLEVVVVELLRYKSFRDLINDFDMSYFGYSLDYSVDDFIDNIYTIYSKEKEKQYGVLGIKIKLL